MYAGRLLLHAVLMSLLQASVSNLAGSSQCSQVCFWPLGCIFTYAHLQMSQVLLQGGGGRAKTIVGLRGLCRSRGEERQE